MMSRLSSRLKSRFKKPAPPRAPHLSAKIGQAPGSVQHLGEIKVREPALTVFDFDEKELKEVTFKTLEESRLYQKQHRNIWLNVYGLHDPDVMKEIGDRFNLHPLVLEDIVNTGQRPKFEDYGHYVFVVLKAFAYDSAQLDCQPEHISLVLGKDFVLSFQERPTGIFAPIRERIRQRHSLPRRVGVDGVMHALIDAVVDRYFVMVEALSVAIEDLEDSLINETPRDAMARINHLKHETLELRRSIWPTRETLTSVLRTEEHLISRETLPYFRDIYDHCVHVIEQLDGLRELIGGLLDIHLASVSHRLNNELRLLTIVTTMLAPATLITGFFGMNFQYMPWLNRKDGWELASIAVVVAGFVLLGTLLWRQRRTRKGF
ncbi:MAG: Magnesium transport protein CorA [Rhodocyclales bacterium]|nr:Magnesium transport protein CorA [Rhodocyclales bacterium]